jgi:hypothetical protein
MPTELLSICHDVLAAAYRAKLGLEFGHSVSDIAELKKPVWRTVSEVDLTSERSTNSTDKAGLLLDPEVGILAYILTFDQTTVLKKQIARALKLRSRLSIERNYTGGAATPRRRSGCLEDRASLVGQRCGERDLDRPDYGSPARNCFLRRNLDGCAIHYSGSHRTTN